MTLFNLPPLIKVINLLFSMKLHNIQRKILDLLTENTDYLTSSLRDIGEAIGEGRDQPQKINHHIKQLEKKGYLRKNPVTGAINASKELVSDTFNFPLYGMASCGEEGLFDQENIMDYVPLPTKTLGILNPDDLFLVKAVGNSMNPLIKENDLVLVKKSSFDGLKTYVVIHNGLPKIKNVIKEGENYKLISLNKDYKPVLVSEKDDFQFQGVIKAVISNIDY